MKLIWTNKALSDLDRLYEFLSPTNKAAAAKAVQALVSAPHVLLQNPRIGEPLEDEAFSPQEVRRILVGSYEIRYEIQGTNIHILRLWHTREER